MGKGRRVRKCERVRKERERETGRVQVKEGGERV